MKVHTLLGQGILFPDLNIIRLFLPTLLPLVYVETLCHMCLAEYSVSSFFYFRAICRDPHSYVSRSCVVL